MCSVAISAGHSYVNIACITLYCVMIEFILSAYSITGDTAIVLTGQSIALCRVTVICQCSTATRYSLCAYGPHFIIVKFCIHFVVTICQISHINMVTFSKWFFQSKNHPRGVQNFPEYLRKLKQNFLSKSF